MQIFDSGSFRVAVLAVGLLVVTGCGGGMKIEVVTDNDSPEPGDPIEYTVTVTNDTECTTDEMTSVPPFGGGPVTAIVFGFTDGGDQEGALLCRELTICSDPPCIVDERLGETFGQTNLDDLKNQANEILGETLGDVVTPSCEPAAATPGVFAFFCFFPPLPPGGSSTVTFPTTVPDSGSLTAVQFAAVTATASGSDCRPGYTIGEDAWSIGGCIPQPAVNGAPTVSPAALPLLGAALLTLGSLALYRRRRN